MGIIAFIFFVFLSTVPFVTGAVHTGNETPFPPDFVPGAQSGQCADGVQGTGFGTGLKGFHFASGSCFLAKKNVQVLTGASALTDEAGAKKECQFIPGAHWFDLGSNPPSYNTTGFCFLIAGSVGTISSTLGIVNQIANWLVAILVLFGIFYGIMGAFQFLSSGGDDKKLTQGKKKIYYAVGGVALGLLVKGIITLLVNFVGTLGA